ncbi:MAG: hypothetical protein AMK75_02665 [Planctomycetes bacterium SM23_65]|nr:MAG: hypothetical protein AMK75_02665 [Planctomycetes bacterium SM23_65]
MKTKAGDRFAVTVADGSVLMEARNIRCGDVWDCYPVNPDDEYGSHMVFTDAQVAHQVARHKAWGG